MKKFLSIILALSMMLALSICAYAYDTDLTYEASVNQEIDVDKDGTTDGTITDETPYLLIVPDVLTVNGDKDTLYIAGIVDTDITVTAPATVDLTDSVGNKQTSSISVDGGSLVLVHDVSKVTYAKTGIAAAWTVAPMTGEWSGNFVYSII